MSGHASLGGGDGPSWPPSATAGPEAPRPAVGDALQGGEDTQQRLLQEVLRLRSEMESASQAYATLSRELEQLKQRPTHNPVDDPLSPERPPQRFGRLAPLSRINGRRPDVLRSWFDMAPTYLKASGMEPESREAVLYLVAHFEFPLTKWFLSQKARAGGDEAGGFSTTSELKGACLKFHKERDPEKTARDKLKAAKQKGSVLEYAHFLEELFLAIPDHPEGAKVHDFVWGLQPRLKVSVQLAEPTTFDEAVRIAQEKESAVHGLAQRGKEVAPMELGNVDSVNMAHNGGGHKAQAYKLTKEQHAELRKHNACFRCFKEGHSVMECPLKGDRKSVV